MSKAKLNAVEQISSMKENGITFDGFNDLRAVEFLQSRNFFFKVKAFAKNFDKWRNDDGTKGTYLNLDFLHLVTLSKYDASLRDLVIRLSLDLEHFMKVKLNDAISDDLECDGYDVVTSFMTFDKDRKLKQMATSIERKAIESYCLDISESLDRAVRFRKNGDPVNVCKSIGDAQEKLYELVNGQDMHYIQHSIEHLSDSAYSRKLARKYGVSEPLAAWNYIEMASFGSLIGFFKYYFFDYGTAEKDEDVKSIKSLLFPAKTLRNAAAHNSCLLNGMRDKLSRPVGSISVTLKRDWHIDPNRVDATKRVPIAHDLAALLICYDTMVSAPGVKRERSNEMRALADTLDLKIGLFSKQPEVYDCLRFLSTLLRTFALSFSEAEDQWSVAQ